MGTHCTYTQAGNTLGSRMKKNLQDQAMKQGMNFLSKGGHGGEAGSGHGHHGGQGGRYGGYSDKQAMREAMKVAKTKDIKQIDPAVLDYAATRLQAGFRGYSARKNINM